MRSASHARSSSARSERTGTVLSCCTRVLVAVEISMSDLRKMGVYELNGDRSLADTGGDPFDRSVPDVAHGKNTGNTGFEQERITLESPAIRAFALPHQVRPREDKPAVVALDEPVEPIRTGRRADEHEQTICGHA